MFPQNYDDEDKESNIVPSGFPSVFVFNSKLTRKNAHKMSQNDLWTYYAKELLNHYVLEGDESSNIKYLAITNVTT